MICSHLKNSFRPVYVHIQSKLPWGIWLLLIADVNMCLSATQTTPVKWHSGSQSIFMSLLLLYQSPVWNLFAVAGWRRSKCPGTLAQPEELQLKAAALTSAASEQPNPSFVTNVKYSLALLKSSFSPWAPRQRQKRWKLHVTSESHYGTKCRQGELEGFIITTTNFL